MTNTLTLAEQIEQATEDQQAELIRFAATAIFGDVPDKMNRMLAAEAYEAAAMMLATFPNDGYLINKQGPITQVNYFRDGDGSIGRGEGFVTSLALAAACCRAVAPAREPHNA